MYLWFWVLVGSNSRASAYEGEREGLVPQKSTFPPMQYRFPSQTDQGRLDLMALDLNLRVCEGLAVAALSLEFDQRICPINQIYCSHCMHRYLTILSTSPPCQGIHAERSVQCMVSIMNGPTLDVCLSPPHFTRVQTQITTTYNLVCSIPLSQCMGGPSLYFSQTHHWLSGMGGPFTY